MFLFFVNVLVYASSPGCGKHVPRDVTLGKLHRRTIELEDYKPVERIYGINVPSTYDKNTPHGLLFYMHGWGSNWWTEGIGLDYNGKENDIITVFPKGMDDYSESKRGRWTSFNCGFAGDSNVCESLATEYEYDSCKDLGLQGPCNCFTCYDDVLMVKSVIDQLKNELCLDDDKMLVTGESNGGIMTYYLMQQLPEYFSDWMPVFGLPLKGKGGFPSEMKNKDILHYHGRYDTEVPPGGGLSEDGWLYESMHGTLKELAVIQGCDTSKNPPSIPHPFGNRDTAKNITQPQEDNVDCYEYEGCSGRVAYCMYDGGHYTWPLDHMAELAFWFFYGVEPKSHVNRTISITSLES